MVDKLSWYKQGNTLILRGELNRDTLLTLWLQRCKLLEGIRLLDVSGLKRVDSAGLALILYFYHKQQKRNVPLALIGVTDQLRTLIVLYRLQTILPCVPS